MSQRLFFVRSGSSSGENTDSVKPSLNRLLSYRKKYSSKRWQTERKVKKEKKKQCERLLSFSTSAIIRGKKKQERGRRDDNKVPCRDVCSLNACGRVSVCDCVMWRGLSPDVSDVTCVCVYLCAYVCVCVITWHNNSDNSFSFQRPCFYINCAPKRTVTPSHALLQQI